MKKALPIFALLITGISSPCFAQYIEPTVEGGAYTIAINDAQHPCITASEYQRIEKQCIENRKMLGLPMVASRGANTTLLNWPLRAAANLPDCSYYYISAGVDHDPATSAIKDYNCGSNTYDSHRGIDIANVPYPFYKMDSNQVEVIAAAAGTILYKEDGNFDRNCGANNLDANAIIITHADGSQTHYWHMKSGSLTSKIVGDTVAAGEYLGVVGSSGSATAPHLHFEVWSGTTVSTLVDPFSGTCNTLNANSWWVAQKPYTEPAVIKASANSTDIVLPSCPTTETPNETNFFPIPFQGPGLSPDYAKFYIFMRGETNGTNVDMTILNSNNSPYLSWTQNCNADHKTNVYGYSKHLPATPGTYTFNATYNGATCSTTFVVGTPTSVLNLSTTAGINIFPNPSNGKLTVLSENEMPGRTIAFLNVLGEKVFQSELEKTTTEINTGLLTGIYFYQVSSSKQFIASGKIIIH